MITTIQKGNDSKTQLPQFIKRTGYWHNEEAACIEIYYSIYVTYPSGLTEKIKDCVDYVQDLPGEPAVDAIMNGDVIVFPAKAAVPPVTKYTDYCKQFNADGIGAAIDQYLTSLNL